MIDKLTDREGEVFRLIAAGLTNDEIADLIGTGVDNAKIHARHIFAKLRATNRAEAVSLGYINSILDPEDIEGLRDQLKEEKAKAKEATGETEQSPAVQQ